MAQVAHFTHISRKKKQKKQKKQNTGIIYEMYGRNAPLVPSHCLSWFSAQKMRHSCATLAPLEPAPLCLRANPEQIASPSGPLAIRCPSERLHPSCEVIPIDYALYSGGIGPLAIKRVHIGARHLCPRFSYHLVFKEGEDLIGVALPLAQCINGTLRGWQIPTIKSIAKGV